jgi:tetratricopeptide (TPR) repeat protein
MTTKEKDMNQFTEKIKSNKAALLICFVLVVMIWAVFGQTLRHEFINFDDDVYVYNNPDILKGLSTSGVRLAFTHFYVANWHPVTMLSYLSDYELSGLNPSRYHLTNVLLHMATSISLFLVLRFMTGSLWRSAFVAMLFAIHPLRVESVAWVSERKDLLGGLFFMLSLGAYTRYTKRAASAGPLGRLGFGAPWWRVAGGSYMMVIVFFTLGLMSKVMLVTLPFVLLLLDFWPLCRFSPSATDLINGEQTLFRLGNVKSFCRLIVEKIPLLLISAVFCGVAIWTQQKSLVLTEQLSFPWRVGNAICSYVTYIRLTLFPAGLAVFYPHPGKSLPLWQIATSLILLIVISLAVYIMRKKRPYLAIGWLWYLGILVPVIGLMQVGDQAYADRYTYLPQIGLYILLVWLVADDFARWRCRRLEIGTAMITLLAALMVSAWIQTSYWRNNESLWNRTLAHTAGNYTAHYNLGVALLAGQGRIEETIEHFQQALQINPGYADAHNNLGLALEKQGKIEEAIEHFRQAFQINPKHANAHDNLGIALAKQGKIEEAIEHFRQALQINPDHANAHSNLGIALTKQGKIEEAIEHFRQTLQINPDHANAHNNWGIALEKQGKIEEAIKHFRQALQINPNHASAHSNLDNALLTEKNNRRH